VKRLQVVVFSGVLSLVAFGQPKQPSAFDKIPPADLAKGKQLYENQCSVCHGMTGTGGKGARLATPTLRHASDDTALIEVIVNGIPGTEMPAGWQLSERDVFQVAAYVKSLGRIPIVKLPGDAARGSALYSKSGCAACHIVKGSGTALGPELTDIGARRSAEYLRESLVKPGAQVPEGFVVVTATTKDGKVIRGERIVEDTFTIQLRDTSGKLLSLRKADLTNFKKLFHESLMPSYESRFSAAELDDVVAYLASLRGEK
jgi:cytochrome c oxidase cbb3-type subunit 3